MNFIKKLFTAIICFLGAFVPGVANASIINIDSLDISGLVPIVLDAFMFVANGTYAYFVGHGDGIIYLLIWGFVAFYIASYLIKLYIPKFWLKTFGFNKTWNSRIGGCVGFITVETRVFGKCRNKPVYAFWVALHHRNIKNVQQFDFTKQ